jgi:hypothetical protein
MGDAGVVMMADIWTVITAVATALLGVGVVLTWRQGNQAAGSQKALLETVKRDAEAAETQAKAAGEQAQAAQEHAASAEQQVEAARRQAEATERQAKAAGDQAQAARDHAETARQQVEASRGQAQAARAHAETARQQVEASRGQAQAARDHADTARQQVEDARRPVLIDVSEHSSGPSDLDPGLFVRLNFPTGEPVTDVDWRRAYVDSSPTHIRVAVPLRNVGSGLAVIDPERARLKGLGGDRVLLDGETASIAIHRERVAQGETMRILCVDEKLTAGEPDSLEVGVFYNDHRGGQTTVARVVLEHAGEVAAGDAPDKDRRPNYWRVTKVDHEPVLLDA